MFHNNDVICFFGDSITAAGTYMAEVFQVLKKKYDKIKCYNCGVAGDTCWHALNRLYCDCLNYNPDYVVIEMCINEIGYLEYTEESLHLPLTDAQKERIVHHLENYEEILQKIIAFGAKPIITLVPPFDDVTKDSSGEMHCCNKAINKCLKAFRQFAEKYDAPVVDFNSPLYSCLLKGMKVTSDDRVHPNGLGHHVMAQELLFQLGETESTDYDTPFTFEEWNQERYQIENTLRYVAHVEYQTFCRKYDTFKLTPEERKTHLKKLLENEPEGSWGDLVYNKYLENIDHKEDLLIELIKYTV